MGLTNVDSHGEGLRLTAIVRGSECVYRGSARRDGQTMVRGGLRRFNQRIKRHFGRVDDAIAEVGRFASSKGCFVDGIAHDFDLARPKNQFGLMLAGGFLFGGQGARGLLIRGVPGVKRPGNVESRNDYPEARKTG